MGHDNREEEEEKEKQKDKHKEWKRNIEEIDIKEIGK